MSGPLVPNALLAADRAGGIVARLDAIGARTVAVEPGWLPVLEAALHPSTTDTADAAPDGDARVTRAAAAVAAGGVVIVAARGLQVLPDGHSPAGAITLTRRSAAGGGVLAALFGLDPATVADADASIVDHLVGVGLLVPAPGALDWGDLRRLEPIDAALGLGRGTPVDRHYLRAFVDAHRDSIGGTVLDVGGSRAERALLGLARLEGVQTLDLVTGADVDVVGDAHDPMLVAPASVDTVLLFNVLEHCRDPRQVVANARAWLRPGGHCLAMVPNAQRLHATPHDYWRFTPSGFGELFTGWAATAVTAYGSFTTVLASYAGIAAEELTADELARSQPDHPVATCAVATA